MPKLKKFNKNKNKLNTKNILISFAVIMGLMMATIISKSYAIYKLQQDYDVIKNKIGTYSMGDVRVAVLVDGKETDTFPTYETNYKVEKIECTNGVTATFDVENWQINIADMSATSTKCTLSFNSKETNEVTPVNYTKTELLALNEEYKNVAYESLKTQLLNDTYPIGSIYISTTDSTVDSVEQRFGGTWVRYATDTTLVGYKEGTNTVNATGGSKTATLSTTNLPNHTHTTPASNLTSGLAAESGIHSHPVYLYDGALDNGITIPQNVAYMQSSARLWTGVAIPNKNHVNTGFAHGSGNHTHTVTGTIPAMTTNSCTNCSSTPVNVQDPYTVVYMYKRTA